MFMRLFRTRLWRRAVFMSAAGLCLAGGVAQASVTVNYDSGTTYYTTGLTDFNTTGADMNGMLVTAYFSTNPVSSQSADWQTQTFIFHLNSSASKPGWFSLSEGPYSDTYTGAWTLTNNSNYTLMRLVVDAGAGDTVFDTATGFLGFGEGTPGSNIGWTFSQVSSTDTNVNAAATYRDAVALTGQSPVGDLYRSLDVSFTNGLDAGKQFVFRADTDNLQISGDLQAVPEPTTFAMAGVLLGITGVAARRRKAS